MFDRLRKAREEDSDLNLIPVMNLFMVLIPFLLMGAAFYHIGVIPVSTPTHNPQESDIPKTPTTVSCNLVIKPDLARLTVSSVSLSEEELAALASEWPVQDRKYPVDAIQAHLISLKNRYPKSNTVIVIPDDDVEYQDLVAILDAMREHKDGVDSKGEPVFKELFPVTVFSRFIPPPPEEASEGGAEGGAEEGGGEPAEGGEPGGDEGGGGE